MEKFILPERWYILKKDLNNIDWQIVVDYFNNGCNSNDYTCNSSGFFYPNFDSFHGFKNGYHSGSNTKSNPYTTYTEINYQEFIKYIILQEPITEDNSELNQILIKLLTE